MTEKTTITEEYIKKAYVDFISQHLEACAYGEIKRMIITMPPRYMKSICASVSYPAWLLGNRQHVSSTVLGTRNKE